MEGKERQTISFETLRFLGATRDPRQIEALNQMSPSTLEVLAKFRPSKVVEDIKSQGTKGGHLPLTPAA